MTRTTGSFRALTMNNKGINKEEDVTGKMRQRSVVFLLDMLFGEHARRMPSFGDMGTSQAWGSQAWGSQSWGIENLHYET